MVMHPIIRRTNMPFRRMIVASSRSVSGESSKVSVNLVLGEFGLVLDRLGVSFRYAV